MTDMDRDRGRGCGYRVLLFIELNLFCLFSTSLASKWALNEPIWRIDVIGGLAYTLVELIDKISTMVAHWRSLEAS